VDAIQTRRTCTTCFERSAETDLNALLNDRPSWRTDPDPSGTPWDAPRGGLGRPRQAESETQHDGRYEDDEEIFIPNSCRPSPDPSQFVARISFTVDRLSEGMSMHPKRLKDVSLFQGLAKMDLQHLGCWTDEVDIPEGKDLAEQGTFAYEFFVIEDGTADVI
jgi:hypothetical protein